MKAIKVVLAGAASALLLASPAMAFHDGGVANCEGCHTMHNSLGGTQMNKTKYALTQGASTQYKAGKYLLQGATQSEACLNCHETTPGGYHISTPQTGVQAGSSANGVITQFTPGGDFRWLTVTANGGSQINGHSINAPAYGYNQTGETKSAAPGAAIDRDAYATADLACSSCHDPHGRYRRTGTAATFTTSGAPIAESGSYGAAVPADAAVGAYRILGGIGYIPKSQADAGKNVAFKAAPPVAVAPSTYNVSETTTLGGIRVAYGSGMSEWCANCHAKMHTTDYTSGQANAADATNGTLNVHPAGTALTTAIADNYNAYVNTGDRTATSANAWNSLVPFETGDTDFNATFTALAANNDQSGPGANAKVMCLSCHRAHASGFNSMLRYSATSTFVTEDAGYQVDSRGTGVMKTSQADIQTALGNRPASVFGSYQRALCNKCHAKD